MIKFIKNLLLAIIGLVGALLLVSSTMYAFVASIRLGTTPDADIISGCIWIILTALLYFLTGVGMTSFSLINLGVGKESLLYKIGGYTNSTKKV